jgi:hypothetical protein
MKIEHISRLDLEDNTFTYDGSVHRYEDISSIAFTAVETSHSVNSIPTGTTYEARLTIQLSHGNEISPDYSPDIGIEADERG